GAAVLVHSPALPAVMGTKVEPAIRVQPPLACIDRASSSLERPGSGSMAGSRTPLRLSRIAAGRPDPPLPGRGAMSSISPVGSSLGWQIDRSRTGPGFARGMQRSPVAAAIRAVPEELARLDPPPHSLFQGC